MARKPDPKPEPVRRALAPLLFRAARLLNEQAIARVEAEARAGVRVAHTQVFPHLTEEGVRLTDLAERMGMTKQAAGELVADLERMGVVRREPDPADGRAKLVRITPRGYRAFRHGTNVLLELERELAGELGAARVRALVDGLAELVEHLEQAEVVLPPSKR